MKRLKKIIFAISFLLIACLIIEMTGMAGILNVTAAVANPTLKNAKATVKIGKTTKIEISNKKAKATYSFKSSSTKIATVSKAGTVTGKRAGTATITVTQTNNKKKTTIGTFTVTVQPKLDYNKMVKNSLVSSGNNLRMKNAIEKALKGEDVTIAYIGGSITEGYNAINTQNFAYLSSQYFNDIFGKGDNVKFINAGMAGTPSSLGMIRYQRDVLDRTESAPDIVFVEFAVNDADDVTNGDAFESLVRNILNAENKPAVVLLFSVFQSQWNLQSRLQPVGEFYDLPMISIKDAVVPEIQSGALINAEFFSPDGLHPTDAGHKIMADCINYYFDTVKKETKAENDITVPEEAKIGNSFEGIQMIDKKSELEEVKVTAGGFSETDNVLGTFRYANTTKTFPNNWKHTSTSGKSSFKMTLNCKNLLMVYKLSSNQTAGKVDVYVDGVLTKTYDGYAPGGWNNPSTQLVFSNEEAAEHTIEIKMASGSEAKDFSILAFGYTK